MIPIFLSALSKGRYVENTPLEQCNYCIFYTPITTPVLQECIQGDSSQLTLSLICCGGDGDTDLRVRQVGTNLVIEENDQQAFCAYLTEKQPKHMGQVFLHALGFKMSHLSRLLAQCADDMKALENQLDNCIDNRGTYQILDFRRKYTEYGTMVIGLKDILLRIDKGYYSMQMQNSYVLQGEIMLDFQFLEAQYDLVKNTLIKDLDTYTSIINNNINRNARLLSIISLSGVAINLIFGSFLYTNPLLGIIGGLCMGGVSVAAALQYQKGNRQPKLPYSKHTITLPWFSSTKKLQNQKHLNATAHHEDF